MFRQLADHKSYKDTCPLNNNQLRTRMPFMSRPCVQLCSEERAAPPVGPAVYGTAVISEANYKQRGYLRGLKIALAY